MYWRGAVVVVGAACVVWFCDVGGDCGGAFDYGGYSRTVVVVVVVFDSDLACGDGCPGVAAVY